MIVGISSQESFSQDNLSAFDNKWSQLKLRLKHQCIKLESEKRYINALFADFDPPYLPKFL